MTLNKLLSEKHNLLVIYQGGGYDGCYWEWNAFKIQDNEFTNVIATGYKGIQSQNDCSGFIERIGNIELEEHEIEGLFGHKGKFLSGQGDEGFDKFDIWNLDDRDKYREQRDISYLSDVYAISLVLQISKELSGTDDVLVKCPECNGMFDYDDLYPVEGSLRGLGGIAYQYDTWLCSSCHSNKILLEADKHCVYCGCYHNGDCDCDGYCQNCSEKYNDNLYNMNNEVEND